MNNYLKKAWICGLLAPIIAYTAIFIAIANAPWFTWYANALSDLGAHAGSDYIFNTGLMIAGILLLLFSIGLFLHFQDLLSKVGAIFLVLDSIALFAIGFFPETAGIIHFYVSVMFFVMFPLGYLIISVAFLLKKSNIWLAMLALIGAIASIIIWSFPWRSFGITGVAIPEFLSSLVGSIWIVAIALQLLRNPTSKSH